MNVDENHDPTHYAVSAEESGTQRLTHADLAPTYWFERPAESSVWIAAYRVFRLKNEDALAAQPIVVDFLQARVRLHLYAGDIQYTDFAAARIRRESADQYVLDTSGARERREPAGVYLLLLTPFDVDGSPGDERSTRERLEGVVGLLIAMEGRNAAFEKMFESAYHLGTKLTTGWTAGVVNPLWYPPPDLGDARVEQIAAIETRIEQLAVPDRDRLRLSLRWHTAAIYDDGTDALIKEWIALETLAMPSTTKIGPLVALVGQAHGLTPEVAKERFSVGRIYGLRNKIVHAGLSGPLHPRILDHMANLYADVLCEVVGATRQQRSSTTALEVDALIRAALVE